MNNISNGRRLTFIVIANVLSISVLNLIINFLAAQPAPMTPILVRLVIFMGLSYGLFKGIVWTRLATGVLSAIIASSNLFYGLAIFSSSPALAIIIIFMGIVFLLTALILFGAQSIRDFMASKHSGQKQ